MSTKPVEIRNLLSFGFEQTFTTPDWWAEPGFVATSNTPLKIEKMKLLAEKIALVLGGEAKQSVDIYNHIQFETFEKDGTPSFVVTMDPGSIEVKTPPGLLEGMTARMKPLFEAAELSGVVPYRNWWYGIKTGTEGGCHVNMAGFTPDANPLRMEPALVVKYAAYFNNNPWIHYPFMGVDVGPGGNCMRMDEHALDPHSGHAPGSMDSIDRFEAIAARINRGEALTAEDVAQHFKGTKLAEDKHSAPSFYKYKAPHFFIEDRAVESLRTAEEFFLVSDLRVRILEMLQREKRVRPFRVFGAALHKGDLSSAPLWLGFEEMCQELSLDAKPFQCFFDRQFPRLTMSKDSPQDVPGVLEIREGRRPRVITAVQMRGELLISKTVDTSFARLEVIWPRDRGAVWVNGHRLVPRTIRRDGQEFWMLILDYQKKDGEVFDFLLWDEESKSTVERVSFDPKDMMFKKPVAVEGPPERTIPVAEPPISEGYHQL